MRNQAEIATSVVIIILVVLSIILTSFALSAIFSTRQTQFRYEDVNSILSYLYNYLTLESELQSYESTNEAGLSSFGINVWVTCPYGCAAPPTCQQAKSFLENQIYNNIYLSTTLHIEDLNQINAYYPYSFNISYNNFNVSIPASCSNIMNGYYDTWFPLTVKNIQIYAYSNESGGGFNFAQEMNISYTTVWYMYRIAYQWAQNPQVSTLLEEDCANYINNNITTDYTAESLQQYYNNPYVSCEETIQYVGGCQEPCPYVCSPQNLACIITVICKDTQYPILYNNLVSPQEIAINGYVYQVPVSSTDYWRCIYSCQYDYTVNATTGTPIGQSIQCNLVSQDSGCGCPSPSCEGNLVNEEQNDDEITYIYNVEYVWVKCFQESCCEFCGCITCCPPPPPQCPSPQTIQQTVLQEIESGECPLSG